MTLALSAAMPSFGEKLPSLRLSINNVLDTVGSMPLPYPMTGPGWLPLCSGPPMQGEVYVRTAYEVDPSRADIWLVSSRSGERRLLTQGSAQAAGYWCPSWSPDGRRLAMLSTMPEGKEPRGGDNVRLYV